jgi:hypothetical protein
MRSAWMAGILSPVLVGVIIYFIGSLFGVQKSLVGYFSSAPRNAPVLSIPLPSAEPTPADKRYSEPLNRTSHTMRDRNSREIMPSQIVRGRSQ